MKILFLLGGFKMMRVSSGLTWVSMSIVAILLQIIFVLADVKDTVTGTAIEFSKSYFLLDNSMKDYLCSDFYQNDCDLHLQMD